ncbi:Hypp5511 [Branchiostoma lanceolatum]|uniref:Hypp5511 protein n=1 Tax=Branchiostoma lanceolatum TaxID=7740 RepID=A0A8J9VEU4_BRALA|nr:Hypp5511 [Branchiostoma lanceolatum]
MTEMEDPAAVPPVKIQSETSALIPGRLQGLKEKAKKTTQDMAENTHTYKGQKTLHEGLQNTALLTSNAAQMITLLVKGTAEVALTGPQIARMVLLAFSLFFQGIIYVLLLLQGKTRVRKKEEYAVAEQRDQEKKKLRSTNKVAMAFTGLVLVINFAITQLE